MKYYKWILRLWVTLISAIGFAVGWVFLAHSPKPQPVLAADTTSATTAQLQPVPSLDQLLGNGSTSNADLSFIQTSPNVSRAFSPRFRTGGS